MTRAASPSLLAAPARLFLAAVVAVGLLVGAAGTASAASSPAAQNAVGASTVAVATHVGPSANISPAMSRDSYDSQAISASATGVAANSEVGTALETYYPRNNGFAGTLSSEVLPPGSVFGRRGLDSGSNAAPAGTAPESLSLPYGWRDLPYSEFRVVEPLPVQAGPAAAWFDSLGGGTQYLLPSSIQELLDAGTIVRVTP